MILKNCYNLVHKNTVSISMWLIFTVTWKDQKEIGLFLQWNIMVSIGKYERLTRYHEFSVLMAIRKHIVNLSYPSILPRKQKMEKRTMTTAINKWIKPSPRTLVHMFKYHKDWVLYPMSLIKAVDAAEGNLVAHRAEPWFSEQPVNQKLWSPAAEGMLIGVPWWPLWLTFPFPAPPFVLSAIHSFPEGKTTLSSTGGFLNSPSVLCPSDWMHWFLEIQTHALEEQHYDFKNTTTHLVAFL